MSERAEVERIRDQLHRSVHGEAWHGPSFAETVREFHGNTGAHYGASPHTPVEIVLHIAVWLEVCRERMLGTAVSPTAEEDWPTPDAGRKGWQSAIRRVHAAHDELQQTLSAMTDADLRRPVPAHDYDTYFMLHGVIQHTLYHTGQLMLLARIED